MHGSLSASEARRSAKEKRKKKGGGGLALYFITYFISWGLVMYFAFDKYV